MLKYSLTNEALLFLRKIPAKHAQQIMGKIAKFAEYPRSIPSKQLEWYKSLKRIRSGEYRIIYRIDDGILSLLVLRIWKRNDGEVYKNLDSIQENNH